MKQFVIGIGSQRAGSTLLHKILDETTPIYMNPIKELHYFDTLYKVREEKTLIEFSKRQLDHEINRIVRAKSFAFIDKRYKNLLRSSFLLATQRTKKIDYIDLYRPCILENKFLGEVTPEYMILPQEGIIKMRDTVGHNAKIILLARNPVKRFISAFKLLMLGLPKADMNQFEQNINSMLSNNSEWLRVQDAFNDYETALNNYNEIFGNILMLSYDSVFSDVEKTAEQLSEFLGVNVSLPNYHKLVNTKINALDETKELSAQTLDILEKRYARNQAYLDKVFGKGACSA